MENIIKQKIYNITKKYVDPMNNKVFDQNNPNINISTREANVNISINIDTKKSSIYNDLSNNIKNEIEKIKDISSINIVLTSEKKQNEPNFDKKRFKINTKNIIAIASGKGGVGKSTFAVNIAVALKTLGLKVGILDSDVYGPSIPKMMGISKKPETNKNNKLIPLENYGVKCMSIGFLIDVDTPAIWRGPMVMKALEQMFNGVDWGELDYLILDLPPGTGDAQLTLAQNSKLSGAIIISTPQNVALIDAIKGIKMFNRVNIPVLGIVENMSYFICESCNQRHEIFASGGAKKIAENLKIEFLAEIPINKNVRIESDKGIPSCISDKESVISKIYLSIAKNLLNKFN